jgi:hypothetical protein
LKFAIEGVPEIDSEIFLLRSTGLAAGQARAAFNASMACWINVASRRKTGACQAQAVMATFAAVKPLSTD